MIFGTNLSTLNIGLMMHGKARWQGTEATRKDFNAVLIRQEKKFFTSELFKVIQDAIPLILNLSYWMCSQCTVHHKFRINSERTKF